MPLSALQRLVSGAGSEASEKNAIIKHLAKNGHRRMPSTSTSRNGRTVVRAYLWRDTPLGNVALVAGPSVKGRVYLVEPVNRDVHEDEINVYLPPSAGRPAYVSFKRNSARRRQERAQAAASRGHTPWGYDYNYRNNPEQHEGMVKVPLRRAVLYVPAEDIEGLDAPIDVTEVPVEPPARAPAPPRVTRPAPPRVTAPVTRSRLAYPQTIEPTYAGVMSFLQCNADQAYTISEIDELTGHSGRDRRSSPTAGMLKGLARVSYNPLVENVNKGTTKPAKYKATVDYAAVQWDFGAPEIAELVPSMFKSLSKAFLELNSLICMGDSDTRDEITEAVVNTLDRNAPQAAYNTLLTTIDSAFAAGTFGLARLLQTIGFERYPSQFVMWVPLSLLGRGRKALNAPVSIQWGNGAQKYTLYGRIVGSSHSAPGLGYTSAQLKAQAKLQNGNTKGKLVLIQGIGERPAVPDVPPEIVPPAPVVVRPAAPKPTPVVTRPVPAPAAPSRADDLERLLAGRRAAAPVPAAPALTSEEEAEPEMDEFDREMKALLRSNPGFRGSYRVRRNASLDSREFDLLLGEAKRQGFTPAEAQGFMDTVVRVLTGLPDSIGAAKILEKFDGLVGIYRRKLAKQAASEPEPVFEPEPSISPEEADRVIREIMAEEAAKMKKEAQSATQRPAQKRPAQKRRRALPAGPPSSIPQTPQSIPQPVDPSAQRPGESDEAWFDRLMDAE